MSRDPDDLLPPNPERPGRPPDRSERPKPGRQPEYSTFRPNPVGKVPAGGKAGVRPKSSSRSGGQSDPDVVSFEKPEEGPRWYERILFGRVSSGQLAQFSRQFAHYLNAGVDITRALNGLQRQFSGTALGPVLGRMQLAIRSGTTLEGAMSRERQVFGPMYLSMIKVAEARGGVPETLKMLAHHYEARQRLIRQARSAMIYPTIVLIIAGAVVALISIFLLPVFANILRDIAGRRQLPAISEALLAFSSFVRWGGWWLIPLVMIGTPIFLIHAYKTREGKRVMDRLALMTPVLGQLCRKLDTARFSRTLSVLLDAGVDVGSSIDLTADVLVMSPIRRAVRSARAKIVGGKELSAILDESHQFYPDVIAIVGSGEETGKLPESLAHLADDYDEQVTMMVKNLGQLVQPLLIVILGGVVLFIILAVFLPIIQLITTLASP
ncbi:MAG: type II secretion system F family protein [Isosphaeraceae bacterium]